MSTGHGDVDTRGLSAVTINRLLENPEVRQHLYAPYVVNQEFDLPYLAGYSTDGKTRYIDRHLPNVLSYEEDGRRFEFPTVPHLCDHEGFEKALIDVLGWHYLHAHEAANGFERRGVLKAGLSWGPYNKVLDPYIKADEHEKLVRLPPDLDMTPYYAPPVDKRLISRMELAMGSDKQTKGSAQYEPVAAMKRQRCELCEHFTKPNSCELVLGYISAKGWCRLWSAKK